MTKLAEFLNGYPEIERRRFSSPTCLMLEGGYKTIFSTGELDSKTGDMRKGGALIGKMFKSGRDEIFYLQEWLGGNTPEGPFFVLVKNPFKLTMPAIGLRNALVLAESHLFAAVLYRGVRVRRPVVPHEQAILKREFNQLLEKVNKEDLQETPYYEEY